ncbi:MAG TPA: hypothetical protein VEK73_10470 [Xanthobacteraceae bacterium]|nr:hypothetical protein [Xanthobacteraceae bacterium]
MIASDAVGYLASGLVVSAFCMKSMTALRLVAVCSNVAFLTYGVALGLVPVCLLHATLLPINCWRLWQGISSGFAPAATRSWPCVNSFTERGPCPAPWSPQGSGFRRPTGA